MMKYESNASATSAARIAAVSLAVLEPVTFAALGTMSARDRESFGSFMQPRCCNAGTGNERRSYFADFAAYVPNTFSVAVSRLRAPSAFASRSGSSATTSA